MEQRVKKEHSVKVPKLYKVAAKVLQSVEDHELGFKAAIFAARHPNKKAITALVSTALNNLQDLLSMIKDSELFEKEPGLQKQGPLVKILLVELLYQQRNLGGTAKPILSIMKYKKTFQNLFDQITSKSLEGTDNVKSQQNIVDKPRYVRINTFKISTEDVIQYLIDEGWNQKESVPVEELTCDDFMVDDFVNNLLVFCPKQTFHNHPLYKNGSFILQDKASCLAAIALKPRAGKGVMDACAAPGMKTSLLASLVGKDGKLVAVEKNEKRCQTLKDMLELYDCNFVEVLHKDFTEIDPNDYQDIEYILVDPSCSGSGMSGRFNASNSSTSLSDRLYHLSYYQQKTLCHAMKFPNVKKIVYSTCSLHSEENENVIANALEFANNHTRFRIKKALPAWKHRSQNTDYEWAELCATFDHETDKTDGFFICVIEKKHSKKSAKS